MALLTCAAASALSRCAKVRPLVQELFAFTFGWSKATAAAPGAIGGKKHGVWNAYYGNNMTNIWYPLVNVYIAMENHHFQWVNQLFPWPFSIAFCMFTRGYHGFTHSGVFEEHHSVKS
jgi:hypothetical protein